MSIQWGTSTNTQARDIESLAARASRMSCPGCEERGGHAATIYRTRIDVTCRNCGLVFAFGAGYLRHYVHRGRG